MDKMQTLIDRLKPAKEIVLRNIQEDDFLNPYYKGKATGEYEVLSFAIREAELLLNSENEKSSQADG